MSKELYKSAFEAADATVDMLKQENARLGSLVEMYAGLKNDEANAHVLHYREAQEEIRNLKQRITRLEWEKQVLMVQRAEEFQTADAIRESRGLPSTIEEGVEKIARSEADFPPNAWTYER